jgi:hypothetical protein|tara:strand:- start:1925 stop:2194 length:270 start_codon:yes stop_codon:yes gene_type:complete
MPFDRLDADKLSIEGTGIGVTLSKRLNEMMKGKIGVESVVDSGSCFYIELPIGSENKAFASPLLSATKTKLDKKEKKIIYFDNVSEGVK